MRRGVLVALILHSQTRMTTQPSLRSREETLRSRCWLVSILLRQNWTLLWEKRLQCGHPCQKQPSTKIAIFNPGHAKSGRPRTGHCFRYPRMPFRQRIPASRSSVLRFPVEPTEAMIFERTALGT
jgi:hypothetical protein